jgi:hypothetical protein
LPGITNKNYHLSISLLKALSEGVEMIRDIYAMMLEDQPYRLEAVMEYIDQGKFTKVRYHRNKFL